MVTGLWELAAGCGGTVPPRWFRKDWSEAAEVMALVGR